MSRCDVGARRHRGSIEVLGMKRVALPIALAGFVMSMPAGAEEAQSFSEDQIATGAELYAVNCSPCHGARMQEPGAGRSPARRSTCGNFRPTSGNGSSIQ